MSASSNLPATPPPAKPRIGRLDTLAGIRKELGRVYREARRGELHASIATRLAYILETLRKGIELEVIEERLKALEDKAASSEGKPR